MATPEEQKKLAMKPIDSWTTREKLALATSVQKSGDQNWSSVCRSLKMFSEPGRPADWFNQKYCAIQYNYLINQIEAPKRKRGEKGGVTHQEIIVKKLTEEREEELNKEIEKTVAEYMELKKNLDLLKNDGGEEIVKKMTEIYHDREKRKREDEDNHQKWLVEREKEIAKMKVFRGTQLIKQVRTQPPVVSTPVTDGATKVAPKDEKESSSESKPNATSEETSTPTVLQNEKVSLTSPKCNAEVVEESATDNTDIVMVETVQIETKTNEGEKPTAETVSGDNEATTEESNSEANESVVEEKILEVKTEEQDSTIERVDNGPSIENDASMADSTMEFDSSIKEDQPMTEVVIDHDASNDSKSSIGATGDDASNDRASRRKKKRYQNVTPNIQTRSTRSQTQVKVETETKESPIKQENAKLAPSKKRSTSIEDSSALSLSEDSNGPKTPLPDNSQNEDPDDDWKETGREIIRKLLNHPHVSLISMVECKNNLMQQKVANAMYRDDDLNAIKNRIETGQLKSSEELKKEFMTIFLNANMLNSDKNMSDMLLNMEKYVLDLFDHPDRRTKKRDSKAPNVLEVKNANRRKTRRSVSNESESSRKKN